MKTKGLYETIIESIKQEREMVASTFEVITGFDYTMAFKNYADAIGITLDELTDQQKQQAVGCYTKGATKCLKAG